MPGAKEALATFDVAAAVTHEPPRCDGGDQHELLALPSTSSSGATASAWSGTTERGDGHGLAGPNRRGTGSRPPTHRRVAAVQVRRRTAARSRPSPSSRTEAGRSRRSRPRPGSGHVICSRSSCSAGSAMTRARIIANASSIPSSSGRCWSVGHAGARERRAHAIRPAAGLRRARPQPHLPTFRAPNSVE